MTEAEIQEVQAAWKADPESRVIVDDGEEGYALTWRSSPTDEAGWRWKHIGDHGWAFAWPEALSVPMMIRDALHRRLLALGAWVEQANGSCFVFRNLEGRFDRWTRLAASDSLISAMSRAIVALSQPATASPNQEQQP